MGSVTLTVAQEVTRPIRGLRETGALGDSCTQAEHYRRAELLFPYISPYKDISPCKEKNMHLSQASGEGDPDSPPMREGCRDTGCRHGPTPRELPIQTSI